MISRYSKICLAIIVSTCILLGSGCSRRESSVGVESAMDKKYEKKIDSLKKILQKDYDNPKTHNYLGVLYAKRGWFDEALKEYKTAIDLSPDYVEAYINLADLYVQMQEHPKAMELYQKILSFSPDSIQIRYKLAALYKEKKFVKQAIQEYSKLLEINPDFYLAHNNIGVIFYERGDYREARPHFEKAIAIAPDYPDSYLNLGILFHFNLDDKALAIDYYQKYVDLKKDEQNVLVATQLMQKARDELKRDQNKKQKHEKESKQMEKEEKLINQAEDAFAGKKYERALKLYDEYLKENKKNVAVLARKAECLRNLRRYNEAISIYSEVISLDESYADAYRFKGEIYEDVFKDIPQAEENYKKYITLRPQDDASKELEKKIKKLEKDREVKETEKLEKEKKKEKKQAPEKEKKEEPPVSQKTKKELAFIHFNKGVQLQHQKKNDSAINEYKKAIELDSQSEKAYYNLGIIYKQQQQFSQAAANYQKAISLKPNYYSAYYNLGIMYDAQKDYGKAIGSFNKTISIKPSYADAYLALGVIYSSKLKDSEKARYNFKKYLQLRPNSPHAVKIRNWLKATE